MQSEMCESRKNCYCKFSLCSSSSIRGSSYIIVPPTWSGRYQEQWHLDSVSSIHKLSSRQDEAYWSTSSMSFRSNQKFARLSSIGPLQQSIKSWVHELFLQHARSHDNLSLMLLKKMFLSVNEVLVMRWSCPSDLCQCKLDSWVDFPVESLHFPHLHDSPK